jgi:ABC-type uncharacterized transport system permease subunit
MSATQTARPKAPLGEAAGPGTANLVLKEILGSGFFRTLLAILLGFAVGGVLMAVTNQAFIDASGYFFSRPIDALGAGWQAIAEGYTALFQGSIYNPKANSFAGSIKPFTETLRFSAPLILAGLGIAVGFRVGLFNIGGLGQMLAAIAASSYVSFALPLPGLLHLFVAVVAGVLAAALWGAIAGVLKATTGAHEVIVTIMLNYIAVNLVTLAMRSGFLHDAAAGSNPKTPAPLESAQYPLLFGGQFKLHIGFLVAVAAVAAYWWLMDRSALGFRLRAVGENPHAAKTAGMNVPLLYIIAMGTSAGFVGLAGVNQVLGGVNGVTPSIDSGIGFDGITVALLGGGGGIGILFAGLLFGAMKAGGPSMQIADVSPEVMVVVQGVIVLFIAAPPLVREIFRLPKKVSGGPIRRLFSRSKGAVR